MVILLYTYIVGQYFTSLLSLVQQLLGTLERGKHTVPRRAPVKLAVECLADEGIAEHKAWKLILGEFKVGIG